MKIFIRVLMVVLICFLFLSTETSAQNPIPNPEFENWSGNSPDGWTVPANIPQASLEPVTKSPEAYSDSWAARGFVLDFVGVPVSPVLSTGTLQNPYFSVSANHQVFSCFYKYFGIGSDMLFIEVILTNLSVGGGGEGHAEISAENSQIYDRLEIPITYNPDNPPGWQANAANITISIKPLEGQITHPGTWFLVDHLTFDDLPTDIKSTGNGQPDKYKLEQNYPNPFNPTTNINFSLPEKSFVKLKVSNLQGEEVATLINQELSEGSYNADWNASEMPSGVYIYTLTAGKKNLSNKMLLIK